jgi:hypothetical protein
VTVTGREQGTTSIACLRGVRLAQARLMPAERDNALPEYARGNTGLEWQAKFKRLNHVNVLPRFCFRVDRSAWGFAVLPERGCHPHQSGELTATRFGFFEVLSYAGSGHMDMHGRTISFKFSTVSSIRSSLYPSSSQPSYPGYFVLEKLHVCDLSRNIRDFVFPS